MQPFLKDAVVKDTCSRKCIHIHPPTSRSSYIPHFLGQEYFRETQTTSLYHRPIHPAGSLPQLHNPLRVMMSSMSVPSPLPNTGGPTSQPEWSAPTILAIVVPCLAAAIGLPGAILAIWTIRRHRNRRAQGVSASEASAQSTQA